MNRHEFSEMPRHDFCVMMNKRLNDAQKYLNSLGMQVLPYSKHNGVCDIFTLDDAHNCGHINDMYEINSISLF